MGATFGCLGLSWGLKELAAAKRWRHEPETEHYAKTAEERRSAEQCEKIEKSGSIQSVFVLLVWSLVIITVVVMGLGYLLLPQH